MTAHPDNTIWNTINRVALAARPKPIHWVSLGDWQDEKYRAELTTWADKAGYTIGINADDLGPMNDHVRDMELRDLDVLENGHDDYSVWPKQSGSRL